MQSVPATSSTSKAIPSWAQTQMSREGLTLNNCEYKMQIEFANVSFNIFIFKIHNSYCVSYQWIILSSSYQCLDDKKHH